MQHLNFYSQIERQVEPPFSARQQARLLAITVVAMLVIYLLLLFGTGGVEGEVKRLRAEQQNVEQQLLQLQAQKASEENAPELDKAIVYLQREVDFRQRLLATIGPQGDAAGNGFAEHLAGLARQHIDGMWFTEIQLQQGGRQMALLGETRAAENVPKYLQKLATEPVFEGHRFRVLRMHTPEQHKTLLSFELRAKELGAP